MNWTGFTEMSVTPLRSWNNVTDILLKLPPSRFYVYTFIRITLKYLTPKATSVFLETCTLFQKCI